MTTNYRKAQPMQCSEGVTAILDYMKKVKSNVRASTRHSTSSSQLTKAYESPWDRVKGLIQPEASIGISTPPHLGNQCAEASFTEPIHVDAGGGVTLNNHLTFPVSERSCTRGGGNVSRAHA